ncbi:MAG: metal-dependent hydrolase [Crocinitomicaceae bacterium]|nr:metal-dependent hydrolase [Crocinitomicaceae bacterium]
MDSLTQIVLGAAVGEAVLGKKVGNKAMLWGAIAGTIPDLDVLTRYFTDQITATEMHRGFSHSLAFCILLAPILGWIAHRIYHKREATRVNWSWLFFWSLVTHPLLDAHTTWGTQFFWPLDLRIAYKNIFVVDPLYTIPFLICLLIAMFHKRTNPRRRKFNNAGLYISTFYMLLSLVFKWQAQSSFKKELEEQGIAYTEIDTRPTPLNTILWNAQIETDDGYRMAYYSLFDDQKITFSNEFPKNDHLLDPIRDQHVVQQLIKISDGWYIIEEDVDRLIFTDLRFGQIGMDADNSPFLWKFEIITKEDGTVEVKRLSGFMANTEYSEVLSELFQRMQGN